MGIFGGDVVWRLSVVPAGGSLGCSGWAWVGGLL